MKQAIYVKPVTTLMTNNEVLQISLPTFVKQPVIHCKQFV